MKPTAKIRITEEAVESLAIALFAIDRGMKRKQDFHVALSKYVGCQPRTQRKYWKTALATLRRLQDCRLSLS